MSVNHALFLLALISFFLYGKAIMGILVNDYGLATLNRIIVSCAILFAGIHLWLLWRTPIHSHKHADLATVCYVAGLIVFLSARRATSTYRSTLSFAPDLPSWLFNKGIYSLIRHPFLLAFLLTWLGGVAETCCLRTTVSTAVMACLYWLVARQQEKRYEKSPLAVEYGAYRNRTGMFLPPLKLFR